MSNLTKRRGLRTALVTGASSGLGLAFARMLRAEGLEVWGTSREAARVPAGEGFHAVELDLLKRESLPAAIAQVQLEAGVPDVLVNNAGAGVFAAFARFTEEELAEQMRLLLTGPMELTRAFWPEMVARGHGAVVNVSSLAAEFPLPGMGAYTAAKGGLSGFSRALMMEASAGSAMAAKAGAAKSGVQVIDLQPGDFRTNFNRAMPRTTGGAAWEARVRERLDALMEESPEAEQAAQDLRRALAGGRSGTVVTGSFLQATLAPLAQEFFGHRILRWIMRHYFRLNR